MALNRVAQSLRKPSLSLRSKHKKLDENWIDNADPVVQDGVTYSVKYIGMTLVEHPKGDELGSQAVKRIQSLMKSSMSKCEKVQLQVSQKGIKIMDVSGDKVKEEVSVTRISYCSADKSNPKIFSYVARSEESDSLECRAYLCGNKKEAEALTLTVALAFKVAYELNKDDVENTLESVSSTEVDNNIKITNEQDKGQTKIGTIISQIRKYQRLSSGDHHDVIDGSSNGIHELQNADSISMEDDNPFSSEEPSPKEAPSTETPVFEAFTVPKVPESKPSEVKKPESLKLAQSPAIISLMPPPKSGKNSPLRARSSPLLNVEVQNIFNQAVPKKSEEDIENWDKHFEELAVSRHGNSESNLLEKDEITSPSYPQSNPFAPSAPVNHNPFFVN